jgi:secondary thiamine-phosphate synthase enzyme
LGCAKVFWYRLAWVKKGGGVEQPATIHAATSSAARPQERRNDEKTAFVKTPFYEQQQERQVFLILGILSFGGPCYKNRRMKSLTEYLWFELPGRRGLVNITSTVAELVQKSGVREGLCLVNAMHISASVFINDDEGGLHHDYEVWLEKLAPHEPIGQYQHNRTGEDNADAHLKRQIMGREVVVAVTKGRLDFGPWEQIFYGEFDGGRRKRVLVKIIGE